jgi:hypothetical protein
MVIVVSYIIIKFHRNYFCLDRHDQVHPEQETQTCFQINRSKPSAAPPRSAREPQKLTNITNNSGGVTRRNSRRDSKRPSGTLTAAATNTNTVAKGIPIAAIPTKIPTNNSNGNDLQPETSTSDLSMTSIPLTPSKRARLLPPLKSGAYVDLTNNNLLNTSAGAIFTSQRQRRMSSSWIHRKAQSFLTPQSMSTQKSTGNQDDSSDDDALSIPTVESSTNKSAKPLRTLPLLNITVVPAWIDNQK